MPETRTGEQIHAWTAVGAMSLEAVFARFDQGITDSSVLFSEELAALQEHFEAICDSRGCIYEPTFTAFVLTKIHLQPALADAVRILFDSLCYLSKVPFQTISPPSRYLTLNGLKRALVWILPSKASSVITETFGFMRSRTDHRRLIFQSLATSRHEATVPYDLRLAQAVETCKENAYKLGCGAEFPDIGINFDEDGDEMYHDVLDVLASTQPYVSPVFALQSRDRFRELATKLHKGAPSLFNLAVPEHRLTTFLSLLIATNFLEGVLDPNEELQAVAHDMTASFKHHRRIKWPMFEFAVAKLLVCHQSTTRHTTR
jgi:hypothetical protein